MIEFGARSDIAQSPSVSRCGLQRNFPTGKNKNGRMTFQCSCQHLCALNPKIDATVLDSGDRGLGNAGDFGELTLAQRLKLAHDSHGFSYRNFDSLFSRAEFFHLKPSDSHAP